MADLASRITKPDEGAPDAPVENASAENVTTETGDIGQADGNVEDLGGSGLQEPEWDVEVSLSELQSNEATPFHSATTWQDLGLLVHGRSVAYSSDLLTFGPVVLNPSSRVCLA